MLHPFLARGYLASVHDGTAYRVRRRPAHVNGAGVPQKVACGKGRVETQIGEHKNASTEEEVRGDEPIVRRADGDLEDRETEKEEYDRTRHPSELG